MTYFYTATSTLSMRISQFGKIRTPLTAMAVAMLIAMAPHLAFAQPDPNLPVFTSPIDITGLRFQVRAVAPDRDTGQPVDVPFPAGLLGPKLNLFMATPLSTQFDQYWSVIRDPQTNLTAMEQACTGPDGKGGIANQIETQIHNIGTPFHAYDIQCQFASTGQLLLQKTGSRLTLAYQLTGNEVTFKITTPVTCNADHGTFLCPNDPRISVTFATQMITNMVAAGVCELFGGDSATVVTQAVNIDGNHNLAGSVTTAVDDLFLGHKFHAAEQSIEETTKQRALPMDVAFKELRDSAGCTGTNVLLARTLKLFSDFDVVVDLRRAVFFQATHPPITVPAVQVPDPGNPAPFTPVHNTFTPPTIAGDRPTVQQGFPLGVNGRFFPPNLDMTRSLPVTIGHNTGILGGPCFGGGTDLKWGLVGKAAVHRLPGTPQSPCANSFSATGLTPFTAYQFSARNCDVITCSLWSTPVRVKTGKVNPNQGKVLLTLDQGTPVGSGFITDRGTFATNIAIPANAAPGNHKLLAVNGPVVAQTTIAITAVAPPGARASIMLVGVLQGEGGCPNHPISSTQAGADFMLFGSGFQAGAVSVHLDTAAGLVVGSAVAQGNGTFCQKMLGVPSSQAGNHRLVALQNGAIQAQVAATFVNSSGPH